MEGLGVDENIAQGSGGSDADGYEGSSSEEDVFARKKKKTPKKRTGLNFLTPRAWESAVFPADEGVSSDPASPEAGDNESVFSLSLIHI